MNCYREVVSFVLLTVILSGSLAAQDSLNVRTIGNLDLPGFVWDATVVGSTAYVAGGPQSGTGFSIVNIENPESMIVVGEFDPNPEEGGSEPHVAVSGSHAYVKDCYGGVRTVDISDPTAPQETNLQWWNGELGNLVVANGHLFVTSHIEGLQIMSLADPAVPQLVAVVDSIGGALAISISGNTAFLVQHGALKILDIADPAQPQILGSFGDTALTNYGVIALEGNHVFTAGWSAHTGGSELRILDVTVPTLPVLVSTLPDMTETYGLAYSDSHLYYTGSDGYMRVINVSDPVAPLEVGHYLNYGFSYGMATADGNVFLAGRSSLRALRFELPESAATSKPVAQEFTVHPAYPNPFNSSTRIGFSLPNAQKVAFNLYDILGREVRDFAGGTYPAGENEIVLHAEGLSSGVYFIRLMPPAGAMQKIVLIR